MGTATEPGGWVVAGRATAALIVVGAAAMTASLAARAGSPVDAVTTLTLTVAVGAALVAVAGAVALAWAPHHDIALLSVLASLLGLSVIGLASVGILLLPVAVVAVVVLTRRARDRRDANRALLAGPPVALGLLVLLAIWVQPPLVECHEQGVSTTGRPWWGSSSGSGHGSSDGVSTGSLDTPSGTYVYRCEGSSLTEFRRLPRSGD